MSRAITQLRLSTKELCIKLVDQARISLGIQLAVVHTLRTFEEQALLYARGRTAPGAIVTKAKAGDSYHNYGLAFDVAILDKAGKLTWKSPRWEEIGKLGERIGLVWGGRFTGIADYGHFEEHPAGTTLESLRDEHHQEREHLGGIAPIRWH